MNYLEKRKEKIALDALSVFHEQGFINASMKDIMLAADVSRGGLYNHYDNIGDVFVESLKIDDQKQLESITLIDDDYFKSLMTWVTQIIDANSYLFRAKMEFFFQYDKDEVPYLKQRYQLLVDNLKTFIEDGIKNQQFTTLEVESFVHYLVATIDGLLISNMNNHSLIKHQIVFLEQSLFAILKEE